ncbi:MAG: hypothetical protein IJG82_05825 [Atopobiaceae bacterium]|nr:hypothetical protein [Atopobiaceae bacterium]
MTAKTVLLVAALAATIPTMAARSREAHGAGLLDGRGLTVWLMGGSGEMTAYDDFLADGIEKGRRVTITFRAREVKP